ncbi:MAG TPA: hypothetical protein VLF69_01370 [Candidatus Saccharimonadales bacterium]|nr:hypothetical protein [Candidatus Saccharimonadales bacterium]
MAGIDPSILRLDAGDVRKILFYLFVSVTLPLLLFLLRNMYQSYRKNQERRRGLYAEALTACMEYREFPFVIYRRGKSNPEAERRRISEALRDVQKRIAYYQAWLATESPNVSKAYDALVQRLRDVPGEEMKRAWRTDPIDSDEQMIIANHIDWKDLKNFEDSYIAAVNRELTPWWRFNKKYSSSVSTLNAGRHGQRNHWLLP